MPDATCAVQVCQAKAVSKGWCNPHYQSWYRYGDPLKAKPRPPSSDAIPCRVEGCTKPPRSRTAALCEMHYYRLRRGRDLNTPELKRNTSGRCAIEGCTRKPKGTYCTMHRARIHRHGDPHTVLPPPKRMGVANPSWKGDDVGYSAVHQRLRAAHGRPNYCQLCGISDPNEIYQWALNWREASTLQQDHSNGYLYSTNPSDYMRLCICCHWAYDRGADPHNARAAPLAHDARSR